jgi:hypothetical protein
MDTAPGRSNSPVLAEYTRTYGADKTIIADRMGDPACGQIPSNLRPVLKLVCTIADLVDAQQISVRYFAKARQYSLQVRGYLEWYPQPPRASARTPDWLRYHRYVVPLSLCVPGPYAASPSLSSLEYDTPPVARDLAGVNSSVAMRQPMIHSISSMLLYWHWIECLPMRQRGGSLCPLPTRPMSSSAVCTRS